MHNDKEAKNSAEVAASCLLYEYSLLSFVLVGSLRCPFRSLLGRFRAAFLCCRLFCGRFESERRAQVKHRFRTS